MGLRPLKLSSVLDDFGNVMVEVSPPLPELFCRPELLFRSYEESLDLFLAEFLSAVAVSIFGTKGGRVGVLSIGMSVFLIYLGLVQ